MDELEQDFLQHRQQLGKSPPLKRRDTLGPLPDPNFGFGDYSQRFGEDLGDSGPYGPSPAGRVITEGEASKYQQMVGRGSDAWRTKRPPPPQSPPLGLNIAPTLSQDNFWIDVNAFFNDVGVGEQSAPTPPPYQRHRFRDEPRNVLPPAHNVFRYSCN